MHVEFVSSSCNTPIHNTAVLNCPLSRRVQQPKEHPTPCPLTYASWLPRATAITDKLQPAADVGRSRTPQPKSKCANEPTTANATKASADTRACTRAHREEANSRCMTDQTTQHRSQNHRQVHASLDTLCKIRKSKQGRNNRTPTPNTEQHTTNGAFFQNNEGRGANPKTKLSTNTITRNRTAHK